MATDSVRRSAAWGALGNTSARLLLLFGRFLTAPFTNRALGAGDRGVLSVVDNASGTFSILFAPNVAVSFYRTLALRRFSPQEYAGTSLVLALLVGVTVPLGFAGSYVWLHDSAYRNVPVFYFVLAFLASPFLLCRNYLLALLQGLGHLSDANRVTRNEAFASLAFTTTLLLLGAFTVSSALLASIALSMITLTNVFLLLRRHIASGWRVSRELLRISLGDSAVAHLAAVSTFLLLRIDVLMVNAYDTPAAVGRYFVAVTIAEVLLLIPYGTQAALFSRSSDPSPGAAHLDPVMRATRHTLYWMIGAATALAVAAPAIVSLVGGAEFQPAVTPLRMLLPGLICHGVTMSLSPLWTWRGMYMMQNALAIAILLLNVFLNAIFIPRFGIVGAALASTVSYGAGAAILFAILGRIVRVGPWQIFRLSINDLRYYSSLWSEFRSRL